MAELASPQVVQSGIQGAATVATSDTEKEVVQGVWSGTMAALGTPIIIFGLILVMIGLFMIYVGVVKCDIEELTEKINVVTL